MKYFLVLIIALSILSSCKPTEIIIETIYSDTTIIKEVPRIIHVPGATINSPSINIDSLANLIKAGMPISEINRTLIREDPETKLRVGLLIDQLGNLTAICEQQERTIEILEKEIHRLTTSVETNTVIHQPSIFQSLKNWILGAVVIVAIFGLIRFISGLKVF
jgi:hypothetical protein